MNPTREQFPKTRDTAAERTLRAISAAALLVAGAPAIAQDAYPVKPIRLIVPFPPGGINDIVARTVNIRLPGVLGQNLILDYRPGAGGILGAELAAKSPPRRLHAADRQQLAHHHVKFDGLPGFVKAVRHGERRTANAARGAATGFSQKPSF